MARTSALGAGPHRPRGDGVFTAGLQLQKEWTPVGFTHSREVETLTLLLKVTQHYFLAQVIRK